MIKSFRRRQEQYQEVQFLVSKQEMMELVTRAVENERKGQSENELRTIALWLEKFE
jgi:hypothetical protein